MRRVKFGSTRRIPISKNTLSTLLNQTTYAYNQTSGIDMILFKKEYDGESIYDVERDVFEAFQSDYNSLVHAIPMDDGGIMKGTFKVTIEWEE
jgi:hypothetical protein